MNRRIVRRTGISIDRLDHLVLTVADVDATITWYQEVLGLEPTTFANGRRALSFGRQKLNLHPAGREFTPHAFAPTPGSVDVALISAVPLTQVVDHLNALGIQIEEGPVERTGATGPITSVYVRDPDANLIEISTYSDRPAGG